MAVAERQYVDPTANIFQMLTNLGGTQTTDSTTGGDVAPLRAILDKQMAGTTPEGAAQLLQAIFSQGMSQVPGLAGTYAQAAGARTTGNSPFQLALQDMMLKLTQEGARQVGNNQQQASQTAAQIAQNSSRSETKTTKPKTSAMQLLPFALANAGKIKGLLGGAGKFAQSLGLGGASSTPGFSDFGNGSFSFGVSDSFDSFGSSAGSDAFSSFYDMGPIDSIDFGGFDVGSDSLSALSDMDFGATDWAWDTTGAFDSVDFIDYGEFFADGGLVSTGKAQRSNRQQQIDDAIEKGEGGSKPDANTKKGATDTEPAQEEPKYRTFQSRLRDVRKALGFADGGMVRGAPGYASGGRARKQGDVEYADETALFNLVDIAGEAIRGVTYNESGTPSFDLMNAMTGEGSSKSGLPKLRREPRERMTRQGYREKLTNEEMARQAELETIQGRNGPGSSSIDSGIATGQVGTPGQNAAALGGLAVAAISAMTGIPGLAVAQGLNALGIPNSSMSPVSQAINAIMGAIGGGGGPGSDGVSPASVSAATGIAGANAGGLGGMGVSMGIGPGDGFGGDSGGNVGNDGSGAGGVGTGSGVGADGSASSGNGDSGVGGVGAYKRGGSVSGPGTETSDSIPIRVSDGEYIIRADVVDGLGVEFFDAINSMFGGPAPGTARGKPAPATR